MAVRPGPDLIIALARKKPGKGTDPESGGGKDDTSRDDLKTAMGEFIDAVKSGDVDGAAEAFESAHKICTSYE